MVVTRVTKHSCKTLMVSPLVIISFSWVHFSLKENGFTCPSFLQWVYLYTRYFTFLRSSFSDLEIAFSSLGAFEHILSYSFEDDSFMILPKVEIYFPLIFQMLKRFLHLLFCSTNKVCQLLHDTHTMIQALLEQQLKSFPCVR